MATKAPEAAVETVRLIHGLFDQITEHITPWAEQRCMTVQQAFMLRALHTPMPMSQLAEEKGCDPSSLTGMIDRIEKLGHVERVPHPDDRRVRILQLTAKGEQTRVALEQHLGELQMLGALTPAERTQMLDLLRKAVGGGSC